MTIAIVSTRRTAIGRLRESEPGLARQLARRVRHGAELLDRMMPGWDRLVDGDRLAMETCDRCVLGQVYGDFLVGFRRIIPRRLGTYLYSAADYGFTLHDHEQRITRPASVVDGEPCRVIEARTMARLAALADLWRRQVRRRRAS